MPDLSRTALVHRDPVEAGDSSLVAIAEIRDRAMIDIRIGAGEDAARAAIESALGFVLPADPRTSTSAGDRAALWLSTDQWLVTAPRGERDALLAALAAAAHGHFAQATDMTDARAVIRLQGGGAREIIMKGAAADLTRAEVGPGTVRRMLFAGIAAMAHIVTADPDVIDLYVFRSTADYAWEWLTVAARPDAALRLYTGQVPPAV